MQLLNILSFIMFSLPCENIRLLPIPNGPDLILKSEESPYRISNDTVLPSNVSVVIQPGVDILLDPGVSLEVKGAFKAVGSSKKPIRFLPYQDGSYFDPNRSNTLRLESKRAGIPLYNYQKQWRKICGIKLHSWNHYGSEEWENKAYGQHICRELGYEPKVVLTFRNVSQSANGRYDFVNLVCYDNGDISRCSVSYCSNPKQIVHVECTGHNYNNYWSTVNLSSSQKEIILEHVEMRSGGNKDNTGTTMLRIPFKRKHPFRNIYINGSRGDGIRIQSISSDVLYLQSVKVERINGIGVKIDSYSGSVFFNNFSSINTSTGAKITTMVINVNTLTWMQPLIKLFCSPNSTLRQVDLPKNHAVVYKVQLEPKRQVCPILFKPPPGYGAYIHWDGTGATGACLVIQSVDISNITNSKIVQTPICRFSSGVISTVVGKGMLVNMTLSSNSRWTENYIYVHAIKNPSAERLIKIANSNFAANQIGLSLKGSLANIEVSSSGFTENKIGISGNSYNFTKLESIKLNKGSKGVDITTKQLEFSENHISHYQTAAKSTITKSGTAHFSNSKFLRNKDGIILQVRHSYYHAISAVIQNNTFEENENLPLFTNFPGKFVNITNNKFMSNKGSGIIYVDSASANQPLTQIRDNVFRNNEVITPYHPDHRFVYGVIRAETTKSIIITKNRFSNPKSKYDFVMTGKTGPAEFPASLHLKENWWSCKTHKEIMDRVFGWHKRYGGTPRLQLSPFFTDESMTTPSWDKSLPGFRKDNVKIGGLINESIRLSKAKYLVTEDIHVLPKGRLELQPGTELNFLPYVSTIVEGYLSAAGTKNENIVFTSNHASKYFWKNSRLNITDKNVVMLSVSKNHAGPICVPRGIRASYRGDVAKKTGDTICRLAGYANSVHRGVYWTSPTDGITAVADGILCPSLISSSLEACSINPCSDGAKCRQCDILTVRCEDISEVSWSGIELTINAQASVLKHIIINNTGYSFDSDKKPSSALRIGYMNHKISNINVTATNGANAVVMGMTPGRSYTLNQVSIASYSRPDFGMLINHPQSGNHFYADMSSTLFSCYQTDKYITLGPEETKIIYHSSRHQGYQCWYSINTTSNYGILASYLINENCRKLTRLMVIAPNGSDITTVKNSLLKSVALTEPGETLKIRRSYDNKCHDVSVRLTTRKAEISEAKMVIARNAAIRLNNISVTNFSTSLQIVGLNFPRIDTEKIQIIVENSVLQGKDKYGYGVSTYYHSDMKLSNMYIFNHSQGVRLDSSDTDLFMDKTIIEDNKWGLVGHYRSDYTLLKLSSDTFKNNVEGAIWLDAKEQNHEKNQYMFSRLEIDNITFDKNFMGIVIKSPLALDTKIDNCSFIGGVGHIFAEESTSLKFWNRTKNVKFSIKHSTFVQGSIMKSRPRFLRSMEIVPLILLRSANQSVFTYNVIKNNTVEELIAIVCHSSDAAVFSNNKIFNNTGVPLLMSFSGLCQLDFQRNVLEKNRLKTKSLKSAHVCKNRSSAIRQNACSRKPCKKLLGAIVNFESTSYPISFTDNVFDNFAHLELYSRITSFKLVDYWNASLNYWGTNRHPTERTLNIAVDNENPPVNLSPWYTDPELNIKEHFNTGSLVERAVPNLSSLDGKFTKNTILVSSSQPYRFNRHVTVPSGITVTIEPGTQLKFSRKVHFTIHGNLIAKGTKKKPVLFDFGDSLECEKPLEGLTNIRLQPETNFLQVNSKGVWKYACPYSLKPYQICSTLGFGLLQKVRYHTRSQFNKSLSHFATLVNCDNPKSCYFWNNNCHHGLVMELNCLDFNYWGGIHFKNVKTSSKLSNSIIKRAGIARDGNHGAAITVAGRIPKFSDVLVKNSAGHGLAVAAIWPHSLSVAENIITGVNFVNVSGAAILLTAWNSFKVEDVSVQSANHAGIHVTDLMGTNNYGSAIAFGDQNQKKTFPLQGDFILCAGDREVAIEAGKSAFADRQLAYNKIVACEMTIKTAPGYHLLFVGHLDSYNFQIDAITKTKKVSFETHTSTTLPSNTVILKVYAIPSQVSLNIFSVPPVFKKQNFQEDNIVNSIKFVGQNKIVNLTTFGTYRDASGSRSASSLLLSVPIINQKKVSIQTDQLSLFDHCHITLSIFPTPCAHGSIKIVGHFYSTPSLTTQVFETKLTTVKYCNRWNKVDLDFRQLTFKNNGVFQSTLVINILSDKTMTGKFGIDNVQPINCNSKSYKTLTIKKVYLDNIGYLPISVGSNKYLTYKEINIDSVFVGNSGYSRLPDGSVNGIIGGEFYAGIARIHRTLFQNNNGRLMDNLQVTKLEFLNNAVIGNRHHHEICLNFRAMQTVKVWNNLIQDNQCGYLHLYCKLSMINNTVINNKVSEKQGMVHIGHASPFDIENNLIALNTGKQAMYLYGPYKLINNYLVNPASSLEVYIYDDYNQMSNISQNWYGSTIDADLVTKLGHFYVKSPDHLKFIQPALKRPPDWFSSKCELNEKFNEGTCLFYVPGVTTYKGASELCKEQGSTLLTSSVAQQHVDILSKSNNSYWTKSLTNICAVKVSGKGIKEMSSCPKLAQTVCFHTASQACSPRCVLPRGSCVGQTCVCKKGWSGYNCQTPHCPRNCSNHGHCTNNGCECLEGWNGQGCTFSKCPIYKDCATCTKVKGCGWCDSKQKCLPGNPDGSSTTSKDICSDWFYFSCMTSDDSVGCSKQISRLMCTKRFCQANKADAKFSCERCNEYNNCFQKQSFTTGSGICRGWNNKNCPGGFVAFNKSSEARRKAVDFKSEVILIDTEKIPVYDCPFESESDKSVNSLLIAEGAHWDFIDRIIIGQNTGFPFHKVLHLSVKTGWTLMKGKEVGIEDVIKHAGYKQRLKLANRPELTTELLGSLAEYEHFRKGGGKLSSTVKNVDSATEMLTVCRGNLVQEVDTGLRIYETYLVMTNNPRLQIKVGDVVSANSTNGYLEVPQSVETFLDGHAAVKTKLLRCPGNHQINKKQLAEWIKQRDKLSCTRGVGHEEGMVLVHKSNLGPGSIITGRPCTGLVGLVQEVNKQNDFVFIKIRPMVTPDSTGTARYLRTVPLGQRIRKRAARKNVFGDDQFNFKYKFKVDKQISALKVEGDCDTAYRGFLKLDADIPQTGSWIFKANFRLRLDVKCNLEVSIAHSHTFTVLDKPFRTFVVVLWAGPVPVPFYITLIARVQLDAMGKIPLASAKIGGKGVIQLIDRFPGGGRPTSSAWIASMDKPEITINAKKDKFLKGTTIELSPKFKLGVCILSPFLLPKTCGMTNDRPPVPKLPAYIENELQHLPSGEKITVWALVEAGVFFKASWEMCGCPKKKNGGKPHEVQRSCGLFSDGSGNAFGWGFKLFSVETKLWELDPACTGPNLKYCEDEDDDECKCTGNDKGKYMNGKCVCECECKNNGQMSTRGPDRKCRCDCDPCPGGIAPTKDSSGTCHCYCPPCNPGDAPKEVTSDGKCECDDECDPCPLDGKKVKRLPDGTCPCK